MQGQKVFHISQTCIY